MHFWKRFVWVSGLTGLVATVPAGCYVEVQEESPNQEERWGSSDDHSSEPNDDAGLELHDRCNSEDDESLHCYSEADTQWRTACRRAECGVLPVYVHYMLAKDLGAQTVHIEAFDNRHFEGSPQADLTTSEFEASTGQWRRLEMYLPPGQYYLRAYLRTGEKTPKPYALGDMELVADKPVGVYGAQSGAKRVSIGSETSEANDPVHIHLNMLFENPGAKPDSQAHVRVHFEVAEDLDVPGARKVRLRLHESEDIWKEPAYEFTMPTERLLVRDRVGQADFVTPSLEPGNYVVFAYLDEDGSQYFDTGEPAALYRRNGQPHAVAVEKDRTRPLALTLSRSSELP